MILKKSRFRFFTGAALLAALMLVAYGVPPASARAQEKTAGQTSAEAAAQTPVIRPFSTRAPATVFREVPATLENASNAKALLQSMWRFGEKGLILTEGQKASLNANKFLLVPLPYKVTMTWDDMLSHLDSIGGDLNEYLRTPANTRLITPDSVLHAYHRLFDNTLEHLEMTELSRDMDMALIGLTRSIQEERRIATQTGKPELAARLERIEAQMTIPLILLESAPQAKAKSDDDAASPAAQDKNDQPNAVVESSGNSSLSNASGESAPTNAAPAPAGASGPRDAEKAAALARLETLAGGFSPGTLTSMREEVERIFAAKEVVNVAPLFAAYSAAPYAARRDYTLFTPRGHYNKNSRTRAYFRAMSYLGLSLWPLKNEQGLGDALLITLLLGKQGPGGQPVLDLFNRVQSVTALFSGKPDDPGHEEMTRLIGWTFGDRQLTLADALDPAVQAKLAANLARVDGPRIRGVGGKTPGFRLLGQHFTQDAFILSTLFGERPEVTPSALFVIAALGDKTAREFALEHLQRTLPAGQKPVIDKVAGELDELTDKIGQWPAATWQESLASAWLNVLRTLGGKRDIAYPAYMRSGPFAVKELQTALGSYTELKHDTILYAKQPDAECGEGADTLPPVPKGFVEPNGAFWQAMVELVSLTRQGLEHQGASLPIWSDFERDIRFLADFARKETANESISDAEYEKLRTLRLLEYAKPLDNGATAVVPTEEDGQTALVADIVTTLLGNYVLYEANAPHLLMLALVGDGRSPRLVAGVVFDHYEFTRPLDTRMTDQDWRGIVYKGQGTMPPKNFWYDALIPGKKAPAPDKK